MGKKGGNKKPAPAAPTADKAAAPAAGKKAKAATVPVPEKAKVVEAKPAGVKGKGAKK